MDKIAVLIPCYNEEMTVGKVVSDFKRQLPEATVYVYDNNSTDNTAECAVKAGAVVKKETKQGKGNVIRSMFSQIQAECYVMVDGDDTYSADNVKEMVNQILFCGMDMVIGDRLSTTYFNENKRPFHNFGNRLVRKLISLFWGVKVNDIMTGYRAFSLRFVKNFPVMSGNFEIETEMTIHALDKRFYIKEIPAEYKDRPSGSESKLNTLADGMSVLKTIAVMFKEYRPFAFFGFLSLLLAIIGSAMFIPVLAEYFSTGLVPKFPTLIVSMFLLIASLMSLFTGLILDIMATKSRKDYELRLLDFENK